MTGVDAVAIASGPLILASYGLGSLAAWSPDGRRVAAAEVAAAVASAWAAGQVIDALAPPTEASQIGLLSSQVLIVGESVGLWCGLAAIVGCIAPFFGARRGSDGVLAALVLVAWLAPVVAITATIGFLAGAALGGRVRAGLPVALAAAVSIEWLAWVRDWPPAWGLANGPELALWTTITAGALVARWRADASGSAELPS